MLVLSRKVGEQVSIPQLGITIEIAQAHRGRTRLGIDAPRSIRIVRSETASPADSERLPQPLAQSLRQIEWLLNAAADQLDPDSVMELKQVLQKLIEKLAAVDRTSIVKSVETQTPMPESPDPARQFPLVLLVEDNSNESRLLSRYLEIRGIQVITAVDGRQALRQLDQNPGTALVLLDMGLPKFDGSWALERIRNHGLHSRIPVFAVSGRCLADSGIQLGPLGVDHWFSKPVDPETLTNAINTRVKAA